MSVYDSDAEHFILCKVLKLNVQFVLLSSKFDTGSFSTGSFRTVKLELDIKIAATFSWLLYTAIACLNILINSHFRQVHQGVSLCTFQVRAFSADWCWTLLVLHIWASLLLTLKLAAVDTRCLWQRFGLIWVNRVVRHVACKLQPHSYCKSCQSQLISAGQRNQNKRSCNSKDWDTYQDWT